MDERLYNQIWGMFEDLARTTAAYRSAVDFAESRMGQELDRTLSDPRSRIGGAGDRAREEARAKRDELTTRAREALDRDLAQLVAEAAVVEPALPAAFAGWDNPVWHAYRVPMEIPMALRIGDLHLPENPALHIPLLVRLPLERGMWIDSGRTTSDAAVLMDSARLRSLAMECAVAHAARLLAVYPADEFSVHVIDPAGSAAGALAPLVRSGVLAGPPASGAGGVASVLAHLTRRVDLVQMAIRAGCRRLAPAGRGHRRAAADRQRLPARLRRPVRHPAALPRRRGTLGRRPSDDGRGPGGRQCLRAGAGPAVAFAAARHPGRRRPPGRPLGGARLDVRAAPDAAGQPGPGAGAGQGGGRPPPAPPLRTGHTGT